MEDLARICEASVAEDKPNSRHTTGIRWCRENSPIDFETPMTVKESLSEALDAFLDKFLYELPVPRFASECYNEPCDPRLCVLVAANRCGLDVSDHLVPEETEAIETAYNCFMSLFPMLVILRDSKASLDLQACAVCLMALDAEKARLVPTEMYYEPRFCTMAYEIISDDTGITVSEGLQAIKAVGLHLHKTDITDAFASLPAAQASWTRVTELESMKLLSAEQSQAVKEFCDLWAFTTSLSKETLFQACYIRDVLEETVTMGYKRNIDDGI